MAEGIYYPGDGIVKLVTTETMTRVGMKIDHIILTGTAAGSFAITIGEVTITVTTGTNDFTKQIDIRRTVEYLELVSAVAGATLYAFLEKK